jgi:hypothetical protein
LRLGEIEFDRQSVQIADVYRYFGPPFLKNHSATGC